VAIIAVFYSEDLAFGWLTLALGTLTMLALLNRRGIKALTPYTLLGIVLWYFVLKSGVHATLAGVALALTIPLEHSPGRLDSATSPLHQLEHAIQPWVAFGVVPIFGFANAGVSLVSLNWAALLHPVTMGVAAGLFIGKQVGVFATTWLVVKLDLADCPENASSPQVYGVSLLACIGFTMSLFIGLQGELAPQRRSSGEAKLPSRQSRLQIQTAAAGLRVRRLSTAALSPIAAASPLIALRSASKASLALRVGMTCNSANKREGTLAQILGAVCVGVAAATFAAHLDMSAWQIAFVFLTVAVGVALLTQDTSIGERPAGTEDWPTHV
jgi:hypothetical protein